MQKKKSIFIYLCCEINNQQNLNYSLDIVQNDNYCLI